MAKQPRRPTSSGIPDPPVGQVSKRLRSVLKICGFIALVAGLVGIVIPVWPTTCFILLSAWCFARSSPSMYYWLHENRLFGPHLRQYRDEGVISLKVRDGSLLLLWGGIGISALIVAPMVWLQLLLLAIAAAISLHLLKLPTNPGSGAALQEIEASPITHPGPPR